MIIGSQDGYIRVLYKCLLRSAVMWSECSEIGDWGDEH